MGWMAWKTAFELAIPLMVIGLAWRPTGERLRTLTALMRETALVFGLYGVWTYIGQWSLGHYDQARQRGRDIWDLEQAVGLPSEASVQHLFIGHDWIIRAMNQYYAWVHVPAICIFLVWLFLRHRDKYPTWRTSLALLTLSCFLIQLIPVAPPRMFGELGLVDTGQTYGDSVYGPLGTAGPAQLSAMPSVHVAWAVLIAWGAWSVSTSRWRWIGPGHAVLTVLVVVATANHWWLDGIVALLILAVIRMLVPPTQALGRFLRRALTPGRGGLDDRVAAAGASPPESAPA